MSKQSNSYEVRRHADLAVSSVMIRSQYFRDRYYSQMRLNLLLGTAILLLLIIILFLSLRPEEYRYFATDTAGRIKELVPLKQPIQSTSQVLNWTTNAVLEAHTYNFAEYRKQLNQAREHFTRKGWANWEKALDKSGNLNTVIKNKMMVTSVAKGAPVMMHEGIVSGRYHWRIELPIAVTYQTSTEKSTQNLHVEVVVMRLKETTNPSGLGIKQMIIR